MVELDRLVKLLVEKLLRSSKNRNQAVVGPMRGKQQGISPKSVFRRELQK